MKLFIQIIIALSGVIFAWSSIKCMVKNKIIGLYGLFWLIGGIGITAIGVFLNPLLQLDKIQNSAAMTAWLLVVAILLFLLFMVFLCTKWISILTTRLHEIALQVSLLNRENEKLIRIIRSNDNNDRGNKK